MTVAEFDAPASTPRFDHHAHPGTGRTSLQRRIVRLAWLVTRFVRRDFISVEQYFARFGRSERSFRRDVAVLRDAGLYIEWHPTRGYVLRYFASETEAG